MIDARSTFKLSAKLLTSFLVATASSIATANPGDDLKLAPPSFQDSGKHIVFVDILKSRANVTFDVAAKTISVKTTIEFYQAEAGYPVLDLVPTAEAIELNGVTLAQSAFPEVVAPDASDTFRFVDSQLAAGTTNTVVISHSGHAASLQFSATGLNFDGDSSNYTSRTFLERFIVGGLEYDQYPLTAEIQILGATSDHYGYFNGSVTKVKSNHWQVEFPASFSSSSFFFDIVESSPNEAAGVFNSISGPIPIIAYGLPGTSAYVTKAIEVLSRLESEFGAYPHPFLIIKAVWSGGMETSGAIRSDYSAIEHELVHCFFGRSVRPASGDDGWIDEGIATWLVDWGAQRASAGPTGSAVQITGMSPYRRGTLGTSAYRLGPDIMSKLDFMMAATGGVKPALRELLATYRDKVITTDMFREVLEKSSGLDLKSTFKKYVYGIEETQAM